jgi:hypothetical protein
MYKLENITNFEGQQILDCLGAQNEGKGSITEIRSMINLMDKIAGAGDGMPAESDYNTLLEKYSDEEKKKLKKSDMDKAQHEVWDKIYIKELILENEEFKTVKAACDDISNKKSLPRETRVAKRFIKFFDTIEGLKPFDVNSKKEVKSEKAK